VQGLCETVGLSGMIRFYIFVPSFGELESLQFVIALTIISKWDDALSTCEFNVAIFSLCDVLSLTLPLRKKFHSIKIDLEEAKGIILDVMSVMNDGRVDRRVDLDRFSASACETMTILNVPLVNSATPQQSAGKPR